MHMRTYIHIQEDMSDLTWCYVVVEYKTLWRNGEVNGLHLVHFKLTIGTFSVCIT